MLKKILATILMLNCLTCAIESKETASYCIKENQLVDSSSWKEFPFSFSDKEKATISFPNTPEFVEENGLQSSYYRATDKEGMTFSISAMPISKDFNFKQFSDFLMESLSRSPSKKLIGWGHPFPNPNNTNFFFWVEEDKMFRLTLFKSEHFVYFLETSVRDELYRNADSTEVEGPELDVMIKDSLKTGTFTKSLRINCR